jgi:hypothetical protein
MVGVPITSATARAMAARRRLRPIVCRGCGQVTMRIAIGRYCGVRCAYRVRTKRGRRARRAREAIRREHGAPSPE